MKKRIRKMRHRKKYTVMYFLPNTGEIMTVSLKKTTFFNPERIPKKYIGYELWDDFPIAQNVYSVYKGKKGKILSFQEARKIMEQNTEERLWFCDVTDEMLKNGKTTEELEKFFEDKSQDLKAKFKKFLQESKKGAVQKEEPIGCILLEGFHMRYLYAYDEVIK